MNYTIRVPDRPEVEFISGQYDRELTHPMNPVHKRPRRVSKSKRLSYTKNKEDVMPVGCFNVPRTQIKPYFRSYLEMIGCAETGTPAKAKAKFKPKKKSKKTGSSSKKKDSQ